MYTQNPPNKFGEQHNKRQVRLSQEKNESAIRLRRKRQPPSAFGERLKQAFKGATNREIARELGVSDVAVGHYVAGRVPPAEMLVFISNRTNTSIHWLITGEGPMARIALKTLEEQNSLAYSEHRMAGPQASDDGMILVSVDRLVAGLISGLLDERVAPLEQAIAQLKADLRKKQAG